jgi:thiamine-monophosphate kinase
VNLPRQGERGLLETIRRRFGDHAPPAPRGMGDDCAVVSPSAGGVLLTTDCLVEQEHFRREEPPYFLGRKALAVNLSDIAAMGGDPTGFLFTLALPRGVKRRYLDELIDGLASVSREHHVHLLGGDLSRSSGPLFISITILGRTGDRSARASLSRSGARAGHGIYVSGGLGGSAAGRMLLDAGWRPRLRNRSLIGITRPRPAPVDRIRHRSVMRAVRRHLDPSPRLALGHQLRAGRIASAAIDLSDGLSIDLARLAEASGVGANLIRPAIPIDDSVRACAGLGIEPLDLALHGGEDYELLFTVPPGKEKDLADLDAIPIGRVVSRRQGLTLQEAGGRRRALRVRGYDHLRR